MLVSKEKVIEFIRARGDELHVAAAETELPDTIDLPDDAGLLAQYGVSADDVNDDGTGSS